MGKRIIVLAVVIALFSCKKDDDFSLIQTVKETTNEQFVLDNFGDKVTANFVGRVTDQEGNQINNVQITIENQITTTDHNGVFVLNNASVYEYFAHVKAIKEGYIQGSRVVVPATNGTNDIQITLLEKTIIGSVTSGSNSSVSLTNGSSVEFKGEFIDLNGNVYSGQVDVSMHYLEPNQENTFTEMPGMLFGMRENGSASGMETYGMLAVNLYSPNGEQLNIAETSPAILTFPVSISTPNAPEEIPLWYFDDEVGYWKEHGIAYKQGNEYIAEVTHFSWWNCDLPLDDVNVCFTLQHEDFGANLVSNLANFYIQIVRDINNQTIYSGYTNDNGVECGLFPKNETVTLNIYSSCTNTIIHSQSFGPYLTDITTTINIPSLPSEMTNTTLTGTIINCDGNTVTNGYMLIRDSNLTGYLDYEIISITDGILNYVYSYCDDSATYDYIVYDIDSGVTSDLTVINLTPTITNFGVVNTCVNDIGGVYNGNISLQSQDEVDAFGLLGYSEINGDLELTNFLVGGTEEAITNVTSLSNLTSISGDVALYYCEEITSFSGLQNITAIGGDFYVSNLGVATLSDFSNLNSIGGNLKIASNTLTSLSGLEGLSSLGGLWIQGLSMTNLSQLENITSLTGGIHITLSPLTSLAGLENITSIGGNLSVANTEFLNNLSELNSLNSIGGYIQISGNDQLDSLTGLENLMNVDGTVYIGKSSSNLNSPNPNLSNYCALQNLFSNGNYNGVNIVYNPFSPSVQDIIVGNCSQ